MGILWAHTGAIRCIVLRQQYLHGIKFLGDVKNKMLLTIVFCTQTRLLPRSQVLSFSIVPQARCH